MSYEVLDFTYTINNPHASSSVFSFDKDENRMISMIPHVDVDVEVYFKNGEKIESTLTMMNDFKSEDELKDRIKKLLDRASK